jgi:hypothetical protein
VRAIKSKPLELIRDAYFHLGKAPQIIKCVEMLLVLHCPRDHALKADQSLIDLIMKLKADFPKIHEYLYISKYDSLINTCHMRLVAFTLWTSIGKIA